MKKTALNNSVNLNSSSENSLGVVLVLLAALCFSFQGIAAKIAYQHGVSIAAILTIRKIIILPLLWLLAIKFLPLKKIFCGKKNIINSMLSGVLGFYIVPWIAFTALTMIGAGIERLLLYVYPVFVIIISAILYKKMPSRIHIFVFFLSQIGMALLIGLGSHINIIDANMEGSLLTILNAFLFAAFVVITQIMVRKIGSLPFLLWGVMGASIAVFIHYGLINFSAADYKLSWVGFGLVVFIALITFIPSYIFSEGIKIIGAPRASLITAISPLATVLFSYFILAETLTLLQICGALIIVVAVVSLEKTIIIKFFKEIKF